MQIKLVDVVVVVVVGALLSNKEQEITLE